jgi:hypothetical protein
MTDLMKAFGQSATFKTRLLCAAAGILCLFFPGMMLTLIAKSMVIAFKKLSYTERHELVKILNDTSD